MIQHIAMFKFEQFNEESDKNYYHKRIQNAFVGLENKIPEIKSLKIGFDILFSDASMDIAICVQINNLVDLEIYANHPEHLKVASIIREKAIERKVIDFEI